MKILILDIETTGFNKYYDAIVEIGIAMVDTDTGVITTEFDKVVRDRLFNEQKHGNSWIFSNSSLTVKDVMNANTLEHYRAEIQRILDKYPITAFNMKFDSGFMGARGFKFKQTKCLMDASKVYNRNKDKSGKQKTPSVEEIYRQFFPLENYIEKHRGCDDAYHEGKILLKLVELKKQSKNGTTNT